MHAISSATTIRFRAPSPIICLAPTNLQSLTSEDVLQPSTRVIRGPSNTLRPVPPAPTPGAQDTRSASEEACSHYFESLGAPALALSEST